MQKIDFNKECYRRNCIDMIEPEKIAKEVEKFIKYR